MPPKIPKTIRVHGLDFDVWQLADGRLAFDYMDGSTRRVVKKTTLEKLRAEAERIALNIVNANTAAKDMSADEHRIYVAARDALAPHRREVDAVARDASEALRILGPDSHVSFSDLARFYLSRNPKRLSTPPTADIVRELIATRREKGRSDIYIRNLTCDLGRFADAFPDIAKCDETQIREHLRAILAEGASQRRRDNIRDAIVTLFRFARAKEWLSPDHTTAAERIERVAPGVDEVSTYTPAEIFLLLEHVSPTWKPFIAIGAFAGLRNSEILRLEWSAIKWDEKVIAVKRSIARKVRTARQAPLLPNLAEWLADYRTHHGKIIRFSNEKAALKALSAEIELLQKSTGIAWKKNACRHSFGSYRLATIKNAAQLALEMGNSEAKIRENYNDPKSEAEATAWFNTTPSTLDNVMPLPLQFRAG
jgi:integrase